MKFFLVSIAVLLILVPSVFGIAVSSAIPLVTLSVAFLVSVFLVHYFKAEYLGFMLVGACTGFVLNRFLSADFFADMPLSFFALIPNSMIVAFGLITAFIARKPFETSKQSFRSNRIRFMFLGVSLISLVFALLAFKNLVEDYMGLLPLIGIYPGNARVLVNFAILVNIFKSLFLTGLFSFFERLSLIIEDTRRP